jgi:cell division protein FtsW
MADRRTSDARPSEQTVEYSLLLTATFVLLALGAVMVFSASSARAVLLHTGDPAQYLIRYVGYGAIGLGLMWFMSRRPLGALPRLAGPLLGVAFVCLLLVMTPMGVEINGAKRWLGAGPLQFQPSELMKLALLLYAVTMICERPRAIRDPRLLMPLVLVSSAAFILVLAQPDLGTVLVMCFTLVAVLVAAGLPMHYLGKLGLIGVGLVTMFALSAGYRRERLMTFLNPWDHARDAGFQSVQGQIALGSGGPFGQGVGQGQAKNLFLPEAHTDFILANLGEELGVIGILVLLCLYAMIAYAGLRVAKNAERGFPQLLATGLTALIMCQALLNVFAVLGLAPLTGVPLPLISYGSTNLVVMLIVIGLLLNVARNPRSDRSDRANWGGFPDEVKATDLRRVKESQRATEDRYRSGRDGGPRRAGAGGRRRP